MALQIDLALTMVLLVVGIGVALITSMVGLGGGIIFVPVLLLFFQFPAKSAIPISLLAMTGNTISCSIAYIWQRRINYKLAFLYDVMDPAGIYVGALLVTVLFEDVLIGIVAGIILLLGLSLIRKARENQKSLTMDQRISCQMEHDYPKNNAQTSQAPGISTPSNPIAAKDVKITNIPAALTSSFGSGFVSGLAGLGGGITDTTSMILLGVPPHIAAPTSEFAMMFTNILAVITHALMGNMVWEAALPLMIGAVIGAQLGAHYSKRVKSHVLIYILIGFAWFSAIRMLVSVFIGV